LHSRLGEKTLRGRQGVLRLVCLSNVIKKDIYSFLLKNHNNRRETPSRNLRVVSLILLLFSAFAHSSAVLAVLEIIPSSEVEEELSIDELRLLSDELRRQAVNILPANEFNVLTRDGMIALIPADEEEAECLAQSCAVEIGRAIGAEYISSGRIAKFAGKLSLTVELYETMSGRLLGSFLTYGTSIEGLMETIKAESPAMFEKAKTHYFASKEKPKPAVSIETGIKKEEPSSGMSRWVAIGLDVLGAGAIGFGVYQDRRAASHKKDYGDIQDGSPQGDFDEAYKKVKSSRDMRNIVYIAGGVLLLGGVSVHIFF
jgi:TolB-like protein